MQKAGARELKEETGLDFTSVKANEMFSKPLFTTIGMTDESCATVYGYASGNISKAGLEDNEDLEVVLADGKRYAGFYRKNMCRLTADTSDAFSVPYSRRSILFPEVTADAYEFQDCSGSSHADLFIDFTWHGFPESSYYVGYRAESCQPRRFFR